jgi:lipopolysaccharide/colanic/teichoic acid biosynthesis glycosyltransferase
MYFGLIAIVLGLSKVHASIVADPPYDFTLQGAQVGWSLTFMAVLLLAAYGSGLPDVPRTPRLALAASVVAPLLASGAISLAQLLFASALLPRFVVFGTVVLAIPWALMCSGMAAQGRVRDESRARVLMVGDPAEADVLADEVLKAPERPATVIGRLRVDEAVAHGTSRPLVEAVVAQRANLVILDRGAQADDNIVAQAASLHEAGIRIRTLTLFYEQWLGKLPLHEIERVSLLFDIGELHRARYGRVKRILDVAAGGAALLALLVVMPFVVLGNLAGNRGPLLFKQPRVGKNGRVFTILKFRTMRAGEVLGEWTTEDDPRITPFGRVLRRTHIDELPQALNMLRGDLSIVGPRPEQPQYVAELREKLPFYDLRHLIRPGLTGWAQVKYRYASNEVDALEKLQYEFFYLRHQNVSLDLRIIVRTLRSVSGAQGR